MMKYDRRRLLLHAGLGGLGIAGCLGGCKSAPMTGRKQLILMPESQEMSLGLQAYTETLAEQEESRNVPLTQLVSRVGKRIAGVSGRTDFDWEFRLIASDEQNAFCLPGGKVAIYEGILPVCENEAGLAVVMAHEVAHALARHGGERMSQSMVNDGAKAVVDKIARTKAPDKADLLLQAYGVATEYGVILPYSRKQESEADHIGVMLMAKAGYDPNEAPRFWSRFSAVGGDKPAEFMSTHPSDDRRERDLLALMTEAGTHYETAAEKYGRGQAIVAPAA
jgi:metalloendopeptidase OMA1, mitochondrial